MFWQKERTTIIAALYHHPIFFFNSCIVSRVSFVISAICSSGSPASIIDKIISLRPRFSPVLINISRSLIAFVSLHIQDVFSRPHLICPPLYASSKQEFFLAIFSKSSLRLPFKKRIHCIKSVSLFCSGGNLGSSKICISKSICTSLSNCTRTSRIPYLSSSESFLRIVGEAQYLQFHLDACLI